MKFSALLIDGRVLTEEDYSSVSHLPLGEVTEFVIQVGGCPPVQLKADVLNGERIHFFTRHVIPVGNPSLERVSVPVFEIQKNEKMVCRLYWHPEVGPLLSTQDLYF